MSITRTFTRAQLDAWGAPYDMADAAYVAEHPGWFNDHPNSAIELHDAQVDSRRWVAVHELVFQAPDDGKAWRVRYERGLTEMQDADAWNYEDSVTGTEVVQQSETVTVWADATEQAEQTPAEPRRVLTANEYSRAWHAIEGAAGAEDADPSTILAAVLHALQIDAPDAVTTEAPTDELDAIRAQLGAAAIVVIRRIADNPETDEYGVSASTHGISPAHIAQALDSLAARILDDATEGTDAR